ncbi:MAG: acyclic terpene utilization AtuA family protein [Pseudonocardiaceae bacterium]|nr:acyclic terpene utilization AtuA family protein [Pseudonocardiaceae bacterium]
MTGALRIGNASGFYGDRFAAVREMLDGGPLDVLTGDYLAELTMLILGRDRLKDANRGYAKTFLRQMEDGLGLALERGVKIVTNAGGLDPAGLATALHELAERLGLNVRIAHVEGDDLVDRAAELGFGKPLTANAYLGAWGIVACLRSGADVVVTGRVTDASLVVGPAAAHFGWARDDYDALAGAVAAGHVIECGAQATGGNYSFFTRHDVHRPGFPIAEIHPDGSSVITKHAGTGGAVTAGTVTAQLLYEISGARYAGPDVTARFDTIELSEVNADRVRIDGVRGEPPPPDVKVCLNSLGGYRNEVNFVLTGLDIEDKAELARAQLTQAMSARRPAEMRWQLVRTEHPDAGTEEQASALLRCTVKDPDAAVVGRAFSGAAVELALASYPGFHLTAPPGDASPYGVYTPAFVDAKLVGHTAVLADGTSADVEPPGTTRELEPVPEPALPATPSSGPTRRVPLGVLAAARSGDKGGSANVGVWVEDDPSWRWLAETLTVPLFRQLLPEAAELPVIRHVLPNLRAVNFVVDGLLGEGVAAQARFDPQAKAVGEWLRSRYLEIPEELL